MGGFFGEAGLDGLLSVRGGALAHALAFDKDHGLEQKVGLARFTLHVIDGVFEFNVSIETKNGHGELS